MRTTKTSLLSTVLVIIISTLSSINVSAQNNEDVFEAYRKRAESKFNAKKQSFEKIFNSYRDSINNEFSQYLERRWEEISLNKSFPNPFKPEPKPVVDNTPVTTSTPLPHVQPKPEPKVPEPTPAAPVIEEAPVPADETFKFDFFGVLCKVNLPDPKTFAVQGTSNEEISQAWKAVSSGPFNAFVNDCTKYRNELNLCDWGTYQFVLEASKAYFGNPESNESAMFQMYALSQMGYKIRLGKQNNKLINLIAFQEKIFAVPYLTIDGTEFYFLGSKLMDTGIQLCDFSFPEEKRASMRVNSLPKLPHRETPKKFVKSRAYPHVSANISVNDNLIRFMDTYPCCSWELFAEASLSQNVKDQLYPSLKKTIAGLSEKEAANILLNLIQTGFEYKTDGDQFGREKTFFGDEPFFYPYCDCEDRSILYAILVKDLMNLDVVLLDYPSHIATAVCFNENITGDYFDIDGKKYVICDPTYIGAPIGKSMPDMLNLKANILRIR